MDELIKTLDQIGYSCDPTMTLSEIIANAMQDAQYSPNSHEIVLTLRKYSQYGHLTVEALRKLTK